MTDDNVAATARFAHEYDFIHARGGRIRPLCRAAEW
jgi:hypothetical protein